MSDQLAVQIQEHAEQLYQTLRLVFPTPGEVAELRMLIRDKKGGVSDYYHTSDEGLRQMALDAAVEDALNKGDLYFALNPRHPSLLKLADHTLGSSTCGSDDTTTRRQWLLVDIDPTRAVKGGMATESEKKAAKKMLRSLLVWLSNQWKWPAPTVLGDSGNGFHALWPINLPAQDDGIVSACLQAMAAKFNSADASVDARLGDAARICRLYGCWNRKGDNTAARPHRQSKLLQANPAVLLSRELLLALAESAPTTHSVSVAKASPRSRPTTRTKRNAQPATSNALDLAREWIAKQPPAVEGENGSGSCFAVACALVRDWALPRTAARTLLAEYSERCLPPWSDNEIDHKLDDAEKAAAAEPDVLGWRVRQAENDDGDGKRGGAELLCTILTERTTLWHTADNTAYASIHHEDHTENYSVSSKTFETWLGSAFYKHAGKIAKQHALKDAINTATGLAVYDGEQHPVFVRVAGIEDRIYLDLGNEGWEAVEIDATGWRIVTEMPVKFRRPSGQLPLPRPEHGSGIEALRGFVPGASDTDFILLVAFLVSALRPDGPYPSLVLTGKQGSGKSTLSRMIRSLIDPNDVALRQVPHTDQYSAIEASNNALVVFDNMSVMPPWLSDAICRLCTGGGFAARTLYTDSEQTILRFCRPSVINGITDLATKGDLLERSILMELESITARKDEKAFWSEFEAARPQLLGALLDGVASALANLPTLQMDNPPRMADFAKWATAAGPALGWKPGDFMDAYTENISKGTTLALEEVTFVPYLRLFAERNARWEGTATDLLDGINRLASGSHDRHSRTWPSNASKLSGQLKRIAPALKAAGITIDRRKTGKTGRLLTIDLDPTV